LRSDISDDQIISAMEFYADRNMIECYSVGGHEYFYVTNFKSYQRGLDKESASELPEPPEPEEKESDPELVKIYSRVTPELVKSYSRSDADADADSKAEADAEVASPPSPSVSGLVWDESVKEFDDSGSLIIDRAFCKVTGFYPPKEVDRVRKTIQLIARRESIAIAPSNEDKLSDILRPYYLAWRKRKAKNGAAYSATSLVWLIEWAASGSIPPETATTKRSVFGGSESLNEGMTREELIKARKSRPKIVNSGNSP
jgi:hypothetical protein